VNPAVSKAAQRRLLSVIMAAYLILGIGYSAITPIFEASDELWHYPMVKYLADHELALPPQDVGVITPWRQEGSQPPLYYMLAAVVTGGIDSDDLDMVRRQNPHADIGVVRPDGNVNMIVHRAELEAFPWRGAALAVHVARLFSVALGLGTLWVTWRLGMALFPQQPLIALGAAALNAFLPMFLFIAGSVNNDNLSNLLGNLLTLLIVLLLASQAQPRLRDYVLIGVVTGAGLLAKLNIGFLVPLVALAFLVLTLRLRSPRPLLLGGLISGGLTIAIAGWWYWRNFQLYGDPSGVNRFLDIVGRRAIPANAAQLWAERDSFAQAFWGFFGGVNVPLPDPVYAVFNLIGIIGLMGTAAFIIVALARRQWPLERWLPAAVTIIWPLVTFVSYLRWTAETPASQGRLIFGALSALCVWCAVGLTWWLPARLRPWSLTAVVSFFLVVAAAAPLAVIAPAYAAPESLPIGTSQVAFREAEGGAVGLLDARVLTPVVQPEDYVEMAFDWQIDAPLARDWSLFVHLVTEDGVIISQRDVYPGGGSLAASDLAAGFAWRNPLAIWVPPAAYAPSTLDVRVGWYHLPSGERLILDDGEEMIVIGQVELEPRPALDGASDVPNPIGINFDRQIELVGYALSTLSAAPGESIELTLYWRGLAPIENDYIVFAHIIEPTTLSIYAGSDAAPAAWSAPTSTWQTGTIIEDTHTLTLAPETPPGIYELEIGFYLPTPDGGFARLRVVTADGGMADDYAYLTRVRVLPVASAE
jgi:4-amino-4-deoxy-L-arabinose transferase-like glycosyltransferase